MKIITALLLLCHLLFSTYASASDFSYTFKNLDSRLTKVQKQKIVNFDKIKDFNFWLNKAKDDLETQSFLASLIFDKLEDKTIGIDLFLDIYNRTGVDEKSSKTDMNALNLAKVYMEGNHTEVKPISAIKILLELAKKGHYEGAYELGNYLGNSNLFPKAKSLDYIWGTYHKDGPKLFFKDFIPTRAYSYDDKEKAEPNKSLFKACNNQFSKDNKIIKLFNQAQEKLLENDNVTKPELAQAYKSLSLSAPTTVNFKKIDAHSLLQTLINPKINYPEKYMKFIDKASDVKFEINVNDTALELVYQQILEIMGYEVTCYENWLMFSRGDSLKAKGRIKIFSNFITKHELINNETVRITWDNGTIYLGGYQDGNPQGAGKFTYQDKGQIQYISEGVFKDGKLEGQGKEYNIDGTYSYTGEYHNGLFHGQGHLKDLDHYTMVDFEHKGKFVNGEFQVPKINDKYFMRDISMREPITGPNDLVLMRENQKNLNNYILYKGPIEEDEPNGKGHCFLKELSYDCEFYKGYLIGVGGFSLLPDNLILN